MSDLTWSDYTTEALRTSPDEVPDLTLREFRLMHAALGLNDEVREYRQAGSIDERESEASDIAWYLALACRALADMSDIDFIDRPPQRWPMTNPVTFSPEASRRFAGAVESVVCQRADIADYQQQMAQYLGEIAAMLLTDPDLDLESVWRRNVEKLRDRHGSSFSPADEQER